jgi:quercetin dioxygenase-like cupin family protein
LTRDHHTVIVPASTHETVVSYGGLQASTRQPLVVAPQDRTKSLNVVGEQITVLASAAQTGSYEIFLQAGPEGSGPPPHNHPWDEAFYVIRGEVAFGIGDLERVAVPGTLVQFLAEQPTGSDSVPAAERCSP